MFFVTCKRSSFWKDWQIFTFEVLFLSHYRGMFHHDSCCLCVRLQDLCLLLTKFKRSYVFAYLRQFAFVITVFLSCLVPHKLPWRAPLWWGAPYSLKVNLHHYSDRCITMFCHTFHFAQSPSNCSLTLSCFPPDGAPGLHVLYRVRAAAPNVLLLQGQHDSVSYTVRVSIGKL